MSSLIKQLRIISNSLEREARHAKMIVELFDVCHLLYSENADYIRVNNLGDVHHNLSMKRAKNIIEKMENEK